MPKPLIAIVGRPNVGKSALFNRLVRQRIALVEDLAGTTRDRLYADCEIWGRSCTIIDTGGFDPLDTEGYTPAILAQTRFAIDEADIIIFLTDGREEPTTLDFEIADVLRRTRKPVILAANKVDNPRMPLSNLYALRLGEPVPISAITGIGVAELTESIEENLPPEEEEDAAEAGLKAALVGRPNVGKSALTNRILGYERSIVSPVPGTTRDSVDTPLEWKNTPMLLIDTAGVRRKARVRADKTSLEYHMVLRSLRAIDRSMVSVLVLESGGVAEQDTKIGGYAHEAGKAVVIAVNKWDLIEPATEDDSGAEAKTGAKRTKKSQAQPGEPKRSAAQNDYLQFIQRYLPFLSYAPVHFISAETGAGVEAMLDDALAIAPNATERIPTAALNDIIRHAVAEHPPPSVKGRQVKIRYATQAGVEPPTIVLFVNQPELLHFSYIRYIENRIRARFPFRGVPLRLELRKSGVREGADETEARPRPRTRPAAKAKERKAKERAAKTRAEPKSRRPATKKT